MRDMLIYLSLFCFLGSVCCAADNIIGELLPQSSDKAKLCWASSGFKVRPTQGFPATETNMILVRAARNEAEAVQLIVLPQADLANFNASISNLKGPKDAVILSSSVDILRVHYLKTGQPTDNSTEAGEWPDPLPPLKKNLTLPAGRNQPLWIRVTVPADIPAGAYQGNINLSADDFSAKVPITVEVYNFTMPEKSTCTTTFGFSPKNVWKYQNIKSIEHKRQVLDKYWKNFSAHHISPYEPAPLDSIDIQWPDVKALSGEEKSRAKVILNFEQWDEAMERAIDHYKFNSFKLNIPGIGGGIYHAVSEPVLQGFKEDDPEYMILFGSYCTQLEKHLAEKGWLDESYVYWFDEPSPEQYPFVMNGFNKLKQFCPRINRMLTEQPEPGLADGLPGPGPGPGDGPGTGLPGQAWPNRRGRTRHARDT